MKSFSFVENIIFILFLFCIPVFAYSQLNREWVKKFDGKISPDQTSVDWVHNMKIDVEGNIILTGVTQHGLVKFITTVKYNSKGDLLWRKDIEATNWEIPNPIPLEIDKLSNIYIAYQSYYNSAAWIVIKYDPDGKSENKIAINEIMKDLSDILNDIKVDKFGNIYMTGRFHPDIAYINKFDCLTVKTDSLGNQLWNRSYDSGGWDNGLALALDDSNNVYVAVNATGFSTNDDIVTLKYDVDGNLEWAKDYDGGVNPQAFADDWPAAIQSDKLGNVYVTGYSKTQNGAPYGIATIKYSHDGNVLWVNRIENSCYAYTVTEELPGAYHIGGRPMRVDTSGNVYITGYTTDTMGSCDLITCKVGNEGTLIWKTIYNGEANLDDWGWSIAIDSLGSAYVLGEVDKDNSGNPDLGVLKYDTDGNIIRIDSYKRQPYLAVYAIAAECGPNNSVYVAGMDDSFETNLDYLLIRYSTGTRILQLSANVVSFGTVKVGQYIDTTLTITNSGNDTLKISNISTSHAAFSSRPTTENIPPGHSFSDTLHFAPVTIGSASGIMLLYSNAPTSPDTIKVSGTGISSTGIEDLFSQIPKKYSLSQNYPNPFNPSTTICYSLPERSLVKLEIYDLIGRVVTALVNEQQEAGFYESIWNANVSSGIYFYRLTAIGVTISSKHFLQVHKLILLK